MIQLTGGYVFWADVTPHNSYTRRPVGAPKALSITTPTLTFAASMAHLEQLKRLPNKSLGCWHILLESGFRDSLSTGYDSLSHCR